MKKVIVSLSAFALVALTGCKSGSVSGKVMNPFSGKPVQNATVWVQGTPKKVSTPDGSFKFEELELKEFSLGAGKNKYSKSYETFTIDEKNLEVTQDIYIYPKEGMKAGLFKLNPDSLDKVRNAWYLFEVQCDAKEFGYRQSFKDPKTKKSQELTAPEAVTTNIDMLYYQPTSAAQLIEVVAYPLAEDKIANYKSCGEKFGKGVKKGLFPVKDKGTKLAVAQKSTNLYSLKGTIPAGKQALVFSQGGKMLKAYYFEAK